jgi:hypothetical protein
MPGQARHDSERSVIAGLTRKPVGACNDHGQLLPAVHRLGVHSGALFTFHVEFDAAVAV